MEEGGWGSFYLVKRESAYLGKNDKGESSQKVGLKKWNLEVLKKERSKASPLGFPRMGKSTKGF